jgi:hypothetical protein
MRQGVQIHGQFSGSIDISSGGNRRCRRETNSETTALPLLFHMGMSSEQQFLRTLKCFYHRYIFQTVIRGTRII